MRGLRTLGPERSPIEVGQARNLSQGLASTGERKKYEDLHPLVLVGLHPWVKRSMVGTNYEGADLGIALSMIIVDLL